MIDAAVFEAQISRLRRDPTSIVASAYHRWPARLQSHALAPLDAAIELDASEIERILSWNASYRAFRGWAVPYSIEDIVTKLAAIILNRPGFPKLGPCSWKEMPGFGFMAPGETSPRVARAFLRQVGDRMAAVLHIFVESQCPTWFTVFEHVGWTLPPELRVYRGASGVVVRECSYDLGSRKPVDRQALEVWYANLTEQVDIRHFSLDVIARTEPPGFSVIDVNPRSQIGDGRLDGR